MRYLAPSRPLIGNLRTLQWFVAVLAGLAGVAYAQAPGRAFVTFGKSTVPMQMRSVEIQLERLPEERSAPVVTALAASDDGRLLAAAGDDHAIRILDVGSRQTLYVLHGHQDWIQTLAFSADSGTLYSAGNDGLVLEWQHAEGARPSLVLELPYAVRSLSVTSQQGLLAIGGFAPSVTVFDLRARQIKHNLRCETSDQRCVRFSPDGMQLLCGGRDGSLNVWDMRSGARTARFQEHRGRISTAAFGTDGQRVTSVGIDRRLVQYDLSTQQTTVNHQLAASKLMSLCMINDDVVAVAGADNSVHLYDALAGAVVAQLHGHEGTVAVMTPCGNLLASGSFDTTIRLWDLESIDRSGAEAGKPVSSPIKMDARLRIR